MKQLKAKLYEMEMQKRNAEAQALEDSKSDIGWGSQIRSLLYEQGYTIGGARQKLEGEEAKDDANQSQQLIKQMRIELEELLQLLKR